MLSLAQLGENWQALCPTSSRLSLISDNIYHNLFSHRSDGRLQSDSFKECQSPVPVYASGRHRPHENPTMFQPFGGTLAACPSTSQDICIAISCLSQRTYERDQTKERRFRAEDGKTRLMARSTIHLALIGCCAAPWPDGLLCWEPPTFQNQMECHLHRCDSLSRVEGDHPRCAVVPHMRG
jgi:hypothetical protein